MPLKSKAIAFLLLALTTRAAPTVVDPSYNDGIHLAIGPTCGIPSANGSVADVNAGLYALSTYKTIVSFGDSFTSNGKFDGSEPDPPVPAGTSPRYGGRFANGYVWIENLADDTGAHLLDYAVPGAVTDTTIWPSKATESSFVNQTAVFLNQSHQFNPEGTLYSVFFGINDFSASARDGDHMLEAAEALLGQIKLLMKSPTGARSFLVIDDYGRGGHILQTRVFNGLSEIQQQNSELRFAYIDFAYLWDGVLKTPGYQSFGYNNTGYCSPSSTSSVGACADPEHTFYWINGHPSKQTHRIMTDYIEEVLEKCRV
ncbi:carbohydrate esterase family 16 protein [Rhizoctonia solani]|nr:carbohydrate esterase family 16 protein [Rhizoctonia solani]